METRNHSFLKDSLYRMLGAQETLARYRFNDPAVSEFDARVAKVVFNWNRMKLGYLLQD